MKTKCIHTYRFTFFGIAALCEQRVLSEPDPL